VREQRDRHLLTDLDAFLQEHCRCGDLDSAVEDDRVWMTCTCGAVQPLGWRRLSRFSCAGAALVHVAAFG